MGIFDHITERVSKGSKQALQKTKDVAAIMSLNSDINTSKRKIADCQREIGKTIYKETFAKMESYDIEETIEFTNDETMDFTIHNWKNIYEMAGIIHDEQKLIEEKQRQIAEIKNVVICPECGEEVEKDTSFCPNCGHDFDDQAPEVKEAEVTDDIVDAEADDVSDYTEED